MCDEGEELGSGEAYVMLQCLSTVDAPKKTTERVKESENNVVI